MSNTNQGKDLLRQSREAMRRLLDASFEDHEGMHRFAEDVLPAYAIEGVETAIAAIDAALASQPGVSADDYREAYLNMRQWAEENGLDTTAYSGGKGQSKEQGSFSGGAAEPTQRERDMAMTIRMLCSHTANDGTRKRAMELLRKFGLQGSPLRDHPSPEVTAEQYIAQMIDRGPEPLRRLADWLAHTLDEDDWKTAERMLLGAYERAPLTEEQIDGLWRAYQLGQISADHTPKQVFAEVMRTKLPALSSQSEAR